MTCIFLNKKYDMRLYFKIHFVQVIVYLYLLRQYGSILNKTTFKKVLLTAIVSQWIACQTNNSEVECSSLSETKKKKS